jgi:hypothetical protein
VPSDQHLGVLLMGTALVWLGTIALAVASDTPHLVLALVALLPTAVVPVGFFVDALREHRRLTAEVAELEAQLDLLLEARRLVLAPDVDTGVERRPWARTARAAPPPQGLEP